MADRRKSILGVKNLSKSFGHIRAIENVSVDFYAGEITAIVGDNGAGKSTLIKMLSGAEKPDSGTICINKEEHNFFTPSEAVENGMATVYQDLGLVNCMDISSNIFLGLEPLRKGIFVDKARMKRESRALIEKLRIGISDMDLLAGNLSGGQRQALAIGRAIKQGGRILILDEPTAAMGVKETQQVRELLLNLKTQGYTIIIITHNMQQVFSLSDRVVVMRQGRVAGDLSTGESSHKEVVGLITGMEGVS